MNMIRVTLTVLALGLATLGCVPNAAAQTWPTKPVKVIAVFPAGGSGDQGARVLAQQLTTQTGQSFVVDNRGGASGSIGTAILAKADPDGYTIGVVFDTHPVHPSLIPGLPFDTLKDLTPLMLVGTGAMALVANVAQPYKSFTDVVAAAKGKTGSASFGRIGAGRTRLPSVAVPSAARAACRSQRSAPPVSATLRWRSLATSSAPSSTTFPIAAAGR